MPGSVYKAQWFDPRTGEWSAAGGGRLKSDAQGRLELPAVPDSSEDWRVSLTRE